MRFVTVDDVRYVYENYHRYSAKKMAQELGLSTYTVRRIMRELKQRGLLEDARGFRPAMEKFLEEQQS